MKMVEKEWSERGISPALRGMINQSRLFLIRAETLPPLPLPPTYYCELPDINSEIMYTCKNLENDTFMRHLCIKVMLWIHETTTLLSRRGKSCVDVLPEAARC